MLGLHILLAAGLAAFANALTPMGLVGAFVLVYLVLKLGGSLLQVQHYVRRVELGTRFVAWFIVEVVKASIDVARIVTAPRVVTLPAVVRVRLARRDERFATLIGCLLTLTPGTLALDYEPHSGELLVHALDTESVARVEDAVRGIEARLLAWMDPDAEASDEPPPHGGARSDRGGIKR